MKTKLAIIVMVSFAFVAGYFLGCNQTKKSIGETSLDYHLFLKHGCYAQELDRVVLTLTKFREGKPDEGVTLLEKCLDGSLLAAAGSDADLKDRKDWVPNYIREAHDYRIKFPWTNSVPEIDAKVRGILSLAK